MASADMSHSETNGATARPPLRPLTIAVPKLAELKPKKVAVKETPTKA